MPRLPKRAGAERMGAPRRRSANVAQPTQQLIDATAVRWWRWRHCYLAAKQLALDERVRAAHPEQPGADAGAAASTGEGQDDAAGRLER